MNATSTQWNLNDPVEIREVFFSAQNQQKKKIRTVGATLQSFFLNDQVVTTFGWRHDRFLQAMHHCIDIRENVGVVH